VSRIRWRDSGADHVGHSQVSMTQDVYLGRKAANPDDFDFGPWICESRTGM